MKFRKFVYTVVLALVYMPLGWYAQANAATCTHKDYCTTDNPFYKSGYGGQCTAYAWGRAYGKMGVSIQFSRNKERHAKHWYQIVKSLKGRQVQDNSIAVFAGDSSNTHGHVAYVEYVKNGRIYFNEANVDTYNKRNGNYGGGYDGRIKNMSIHQFENRGKGVGKIIGYIYLTKAASTKAPPKLTSVNIVGSSLKEKSCTNLTVVGKFSDNSSKKLSPYYWREYSSSTTISQSGRLCASNVNSDTRAKVRAYVRADNGKVYESPYKYINIKNMDVSLKSVNIIAPSSLKEKSCTSLTVIGKYSDNTSKKLSPDKWQEFSSSTTITQSGRLCASNVNSDTRAKVRAYVRADNGKVYSPYKYITIKNMDVSLKSINIIAPSSLNENSCSNLTVVGKFSDGSSKRQSPYSWREYSSSTRITGSGRLCASNVSRNTRVKVKAYVRYNGKQYSSSKYVTIKNRNNGSSKPTGGNITVKPSHIKIYGCSSIRETRSCNYRAKVYFTNGRSQYVNPRWSENSRYAYFRGSRLYTKSVNRNQYFYVRTSYRSAGKTVTASKRVKISNR
jgi:hypothetical protein